MALVAERLSQEERAEVQEFVRWLYARSRERSWAAFARRAGVSELSLSEWRSGRGTPSAMNLLRLLKATDALNEGAPGDQRGGEDVRSALREIRDYLADREDRLEQTLAQLRDQISRIGSGAPRG